MTRVQLVISLLALSCASFAVAAERKCQVTRFDLPLDLIHPLYVDQCVCTDRLSTIQAPKVDGMRLAAACAVPRGGDHVSGAFYYVGKEAISGSLIRRLLNRNDPADLENDALVFRPHIKPKSGWPQEINLSPGSDHPEFDAPEPTKANPCWRADIAMEVRVVRYQIDVDIPDVGPWSGFIPLDKSILNKPTYRQCD